MNPLQHGLTEVFQAYSRDSSTKMLALSDIWVERGCLDSSPLTWPQAGLSSSTGEPETSTGIGWWIARMPAIHLGQRATTVLYRSRWCVDVFHPTFLASSSPIWVAIWQSWWEILISWLLPRSWQQLPAKLRGGSRLDQSSLYKAICVSVLLYGCETWTPYRCHIKALEAFHMCWLKLCLVFVGCTR